MILSMFIFSGIILVTSLIIFWFTARVGNDSDIPGAMYPFMLLGIIGIVYGLL